jgi:hypothetical protein
VRHAASARDFKGNAAARLLYDRLAKFDGFIRYDYSLG